MFRASLFLILAGSIIGIITPAGSGWDFANFYDTGRRVAAGQVGDIYKPETLIAGQKPQGSLAFYGAPISAFLYIPLAWFSPEAALIFFKIQGTLALFLALFVLYFHYVKFLPDSEEEIEKFRALYVFLILLFQPFWTIYRIGGQTTPIVFLLFSLGLLAHMCSRFLWSALFLVIATCIKPAFVLAVLLLMVVSPWKFLKNLLVCSVSAALISILSLGWEIHAAFLDQLRLGMNDVYPWWYNSSIYVPLENLKELSRAFYARHSVMLKTIEIAIKVFVISAVAITFVRSGWKRWKPEASLHFRFMLSLLFFLFLSQTVWEHYLSALFIPLMYLVASRNRLERPTKLIIVLIFLFCAAQNIIFILYLRSIFEFDSVSELLAIGWFKSAPLYLTLLLLVIRAKELYATYSGWSNQIDCG